MAAEIAGTSRDRWRELKGRVERELAARDEHRFADAAALTRLSTIALLILLVYTAILTAAAGPLWLLLWTALGLLAFLLIAQCGHDASHGAVFRARITNRILLLCSFGLLGIDGALWGLRHISAHHPHTNIAGADPDSVPNSFLRLSPHHPWQPWFRLQHLYAVALYPLAFLQTSVYQDFEHLLREPLDYTKCLRSKPGALMRTITIKALYLALFVALPLALGIPLPWLLAGLALKHGVASLVFVLTIGLNHYVSEATFFDEHHESGDHLTHQLLSAADWRATNPYCCALMGGANAHVAHHLFPALHHRHTPWISRIIIEFCREEDLPYNSFTFLGGLRSHFRFLYRLGQRPV